jgi:hypothetical protein
LGQATTLLERYVYLIVFNAYLSEQAPLHFAVAFSAWLAGREEITSILTQIKADPNKALRITGQVVAPGKAKQAKGDVADLEEQDEASGGRLVDSLDNSGDDVVRSRKGDVLSKSMMIKADLYQYNRAKYGESARLVAISEVHSRLIIMFFILLFKNTINKFLFHVIIIYFRMCAISVRPMATITCTAWANRAWRAPARSSPTWSTWNVPRIRTLHNSFLFFSFLFFYSSP